ncbi:3-hydroxyacyl-CoA dehydrogenase NAD-binding domain-containing protein [Streptomyces sp. NPDC056159]|uniref:3-hydroxyacyl-CoA dehydrogenase NAD-binding domain-containing protein n=1 Tax=unclassified Streptomyces TaxID=2593676 RepID=UPI0034236FE3
MRSGKLTEADRDRALRRIRFTTDPADMADRDAVIEAVAENERRELRVGLRVPATLAFAAHVRSPSWYGSWDADSGPRCWPPGSPVGAHKRSTRPASGSNSPNNPLLLSRTLGYHGKTTTCLVKEAGGHGTDTPPTATHGLQQDGFHEELATTERTSADLRLMVSRPPGGGRSGATVSWTNPWSNRAGGRRVRGGTPPGRGPSRDANR